MTKYRLYTAHFEFKANQVGHTAVDEDGNSYDEITAEEVQDAFLGEMWCDPTFVSEFDTEDEANAALNDEVVFTGAQDGNIWKLIVGKLAYVEECEVDDDGELIQGLGMLFKTEGCRW